MRYHNLDNSSHNIDNTRDSTAIFNTPPPPPPPPPPVIHGQFRVDEADISSNAAKKKLLLACSACLVFMFIEIAAGIIANSLAIITDASHLLSDVCSYSISLFAIWISTFKGNHKMSFGYHRAEILGALVSILIIWIMTGSLVFLAIGRLQHPVPVDGFVMLITAIVGTIMNLFVTYILKAHSHGISSAHVHHSHDTHHHHNHLSHCSQMSVLHSKKEHPTTEFTSDPTHDVKPSSHVSLIPFGNDVGELPHEQPLAGSPLHYEETQTENHEVHPNIRVETNTNINMRAAYIHAVGDLLQNIAILIAAVIIWIRPTWSIADPICTFIFSIAVFLSTISILKEVINVLMEATPLGMNISLLHSDLADINGVQSVHDLHVWSLTVGRPALSCHLLIEHGYTPNEILASATEVCQIKFGILHTTIQTDMIENDACETAAHQRCL